MISRSQMNRQLYQFGTDPRSTGGIDSLRPQFVTGPEPYQAKQMMQQVQEVFNDPIGILRNLFNNDIDTYETVLRRLQQVDPREARRVQYLVEVAEPVLPEQERQSQDIPEYYDPRLQILDPEQMRQEMQNPSMPGMAGGGIMSLTPRGQYGFGSFVKSAVKGITGAVKGAVDAVKKVADPVAQVLAVVPNPYQPYAQMYTAARSSGLGGKDYGGLQIGGLTPGAYGGTYGINPMQSPFKIPGSSGAEQGGIFGGFGTPSTSNQGLFSLANTFAPTTGGNQEQDIFVGDEYGSMEVPEQGVWDKVVKTGGKILGNVLDSISKSIEKDPVGALEKTIKIGSSLYFANLAKKDQERINRLKQEAYDRYMAGVAKKRGQYYGETPLEGMDVRNIDRTAKDVVRRPVAYGGRIGYALGSVEEGIMAAPQIANMMGMPVGNPRQNQQGVAELDYRDEGGFVPPIGIKEREDDIPAMLSNNEFVFTADAVKNAGGGDPNVGAQKMYTLMKRLENGGMV